MDPIFILGSTSPSVEANWNGNSDRNIVDINRMIPPDALGLINGLGTDNANDAKKEVDATGEKLKDHMREMNLQSMTQVNGVEMTLKNWETSFTLINC